MELHEKTLELNITHELLNLADSWYWFLSEIPLWRYWRPRYKLPFLKYPKSTASGFHITTEGSDDPSGEAGGGYDVRIKAGNGGHLLFIQYKRGSYETKIPNAHSIFSQPPVEHYKFKINSTTTNQHFLLRNLSEGVGAKKGNAVVYAFPLIADMDELEKYIGKIVRRTKFVSVKDIDEQAKLNSVAINRGQEHLFRVGYPDMNKCEVNFFFFKYEGDDRTSEIITDIILIRFQKILEHFLREIEKNYKDYKLYLGYIPTGLQRSYGQFIRYLLHYFEVSPNNIKSEMMQKYIYNFDENINLLEFEDYLSLERDVFVLQNLFKAMSIFNEFIDNPIKNFDGRDDKGYDLNFQELPKYKPTIFIPITSDGINITFNSESSADEISKIIYLIV